MKYTTPRKEMAMNLYDFDGTIHRGDSSFAFYRFCLLHRPYIAILWPVQLFAAVACLLHLIDLTRMKELFYLYFRLIDAEKMALAFWKKDLPQNIYPWFYEVRGENDVLVSASPEFFLRPACDELGISHLIASKVDPKTGKTKGKNCTGKEKLVRFRSEFPQVIPDRSYYDKPKDLYVSNLAKRRFLIVRGIPVEQKPL